MQIEVSYPESGNPPDSHFLRFFEGTHAMHRFDPKKPAAAFALLVAPAEKRNQRILLLPDSAIARAEAGPSEVRNRRNTIAFLEEKRAVKKCKDGHNLSVIKHVLFPSVSRCSSCVARTNTNGWREWMVLDGSRLLPLEEAFDRSACESFNLFFYRRLPDDTLEVPFRF